LGRGGITV